jgi:hypothetical protein
MRPTFIDPKVVAAKSGAIRAMLDGIARLPLESLETFNADPGW